MCYDVRVVNEREGHMTRRKVRRVHWMDERPGHDVTRAMCGKTMTEHEFAWAADHPMAANCPNCATAFDRILDTHREQARPE